MELYKEILAHALTKEGIQITINGFSVDPARIVEMECYQALNKIKAVIEDDSLEDDACFMKIEEIVCVLENLGSSGGTRHDFG